MKKVLSFLLLFNVFLYGCTSSSSIDVRQYNKVLPEAFVTRAPSFEEGEYKKVNSLILTNFDGREPQVEAVLIEDFYDEDNNYIKTKVLHSKTGQHDQEVWRDEPMTRFLDDYGNAKHRVINLSEDEQEELQKYLLNVYKENF